MGVLRNAVNPFSTAFSRWWCHSSLRATGQRQAPRLLPAATCRPGRYAAPPMDPAVRQARIDEIERVLRSGPG